MDSLLLLYGGLYVSILTSLLLGVKSIVRTCPTILGCPRVLDLAMLLTHVENHARCNNVVCTYLLWTQ